MDDPDGKDAVPLGAFFDTGATQSAIWKSDVEPRCNVDLCQRTKFRLITGDMLESIGTVELYWVIQGNTQRHKTSFAVLEDPLAGNCFDFNVVLGRKVAKWLSDGTKDSS